MPPPQTILQKTKKRAKINVTEIYLEVIVELCYNIVSEGVGGGKSVENNNEMQTFLV